MKITLPLPPTTNHIYMRTKNNVFMTVKAREWKKEASWLVKLKWMPKPLLMEEVRVKVTYYLKRERDLDGGNKLLFDALERIVYANDKQVVEINLYKRWDKINPRLEVEIL